MPALLQSAQNKQRDSSAIAKLAVARKKNGEFLFLNFSFSLEIWKNVCFRGRGSRRADGEQRVVRKTGKKVRLDKLSGIRSRMFFLSVLFAVLVTGDSVTERRSLFLMELFSRGLTLSLPVVQRSSDRTGARDHDLVFLR